MVSRAVIVKAVRRPESAAIAGLVFALILGVVLALLHGVNPGAQERADAWVSDDSRRAALNLALTLLPFAGIAFLWFIAVIRTQLGDRSDRFFETVFIGSGLIFVATLFVAAASLKTVILLDDAGTPPSRETVAFAWTFASAVLGVFGAKMAAVFTIAAATAGIRSANLPRWLGALGYLTGLCLMFIPPLPSVVQFMFPLWVALISVLILVRRAKPDAAES